MKNFVKAMDREGSGFDFLPENVLRISMEKLKAAIFDGHERLKCLTKHWAEITFLPGSHWSQ